MTTGVIPEPPTVTKYLLDNFAKPMIILIVALLVATVARNGNGRPLIWALAAAYVAFFLVIVAYVVINGISLQDLASPDARGFLSWTGMHANEIGLQANLGLAILLFTARATRGVLPRLILFASAVATGMMAALTFSRSAFIGLILILGYYLLSRRRIGSFLLAFLIILGAGLLLPDNPLFQRATTGFEARDTDAIRHGCHYCWSCPNYLAPIVTHLLGSANYWSWSWFDRLGHSESPRRDAADRTSP